MKTNILLFIFTISIALTACQTTEQKVELTEGFSIVLPGEFLLEEKQSTEMKILKAKSQSQHINCLSVRFISPDTLTAEMATGILRTNTEKYIEPFDGEKISVNNTTIGDVEAFEFSYKYLRNEQSYIVHGKSLIYSDHMFFLTYEAPFPIDNRIEKKIDSFFNSIHLE